MNERPVYKGSANRNFNLVHTKLQLYPDWGNRYVSGTAYITLTPHRYPQNEVILDARAMIISEVNQVNNGYFSELGYQYEGDSLIINLDGICAPYDTIEIMVDYIARPEEQEKTGGTAIRGRQGLFFIDPDGDDPEKPTQIWTQGETSNNSVWFPTIDQPNQKMTQEIYLTVDTNYITLSNGILVSSLVNESNGTRTDYWRQSLPHAPYLTMIAVGEFAVVNDQWNDIELKYMVEKEYEPFAKDIFGNTPEMLDFFSKTFNYEFPWEKYSQIVVRDFVSGAMENTTAVVYGEFVQLDDRELLDNDYEDFVAHELMHHWFGDLVTCESWANIPLNEAFATYGEYLWFEYKYGMDYADNEGLYDLQLYLKESVKKQVNIIRFDYEDPDDMYDRHSYQKGGRVLHMLRHYVGDEAFFNACSVYLKRRSYKTAEIHDLRIAFEEVTGEDLNWFFDQWFFASGHPILNIEYDYNQEDLLLILSVSQDQNLSTTPLYKLPVAVDVYTDNGVHRTMIEVDKKQQTFELSVNSKPLLVNFDAEKILVCEKKEIKITEEWIYQYYNAPLYLDRVEALLALEDRIKDDSFDVFMDALNDPSPDIRQLVIDRWDLLTKTDRDRTIEIFTDLLLKEHDSKVKFALMESFVGDVHPRHPASVSKAVMNLRNDPSYLVQTLSYQYLLERDSSDWISELINFETDSNYKVREIAFYLYSIFGDEDQYDFMASYIASEKGTSSYQSLTDFTEYLLSCSPEVALKGCEVLGEESDSDAWIIRLGAYRGLERLNAEYGTSNQVQNGPDAERNQMLSENVRKKATQWMNIIRSREENELLKNAFKQ